MLSDIELFMTDHFKKPVRGFHLDYDSKSMNVWFEFKGSELKEHFGKRAVWYEGRAKYLRDLAAKMPKVANVDELPEEAQQFYTGSTMAQAEKSIEEQAKQAERHARRFRVLEGHINLEVTFKLSENDIDRYELTSVS